MIWSPVLFDGCSGAPDIVVAYAVLLFAIRIVGWYACGELLDQECPIYAHGPWMEYATVTSISINLPTPPLDGIDWWRVESIDLAGNRSDDPCP